MFCRCLPTAEVDTCVVPRTQIRFGVLLSPDTALEQFIVLHPTDTELGEFKQQLKMYLFRVYATLVH